MFYHMLSELNVRSFSISVCCLLCLQGCSESGWLGEILCSLAEILRLQDPGSVQLEMVSVARQFPDLRYRERVEGHIITTSLNGTDAYTDALLSNIV